MRGILQFAGLAAVAVCSGCQGGRIDANSNQGRRVFPIIYQVTQVPYRPTDSGICVTVSGVPGVLAQPSWQPIAAVLRWQGSDADAVNPPLRYEINFEDPPSRQGFDQDSGWHDCTVLAPEWDTYTPDGIDFARVTKHTYMGLDEGETHTVHVRGRITFADGSIVESLPSDEPELTLLPWDDPLDTTHIRIVWSTTGVKADGVWSGFHLEGGIDSGPSPLTVGLQINYGGATYDSLAFKYEVNWGDGSGWQDVTSDAPRWDYLGQDGIADGEVSAHIYATVGTYQIQSRVTYWDGYVQYEHATLRPTVIVYPAN